MRVVHLSVVFDSDDDIAVTTTSTTTMNLTCSKVHLHYYYDYSRPREYIVVKQRRFNLASTRESRGGAVKEYEQATRTTRQQQALGS